MWKGNCMGCKRHDSISITQKIISTFLQEGFQKWFFDLQRRLVYCLEYIHT